MTGAASVRPSKDLHKEAVRRASRLPCLHLAACLEHQCGAVADTLDKGHQAHDIGIKRVNIQGRVYDLELFGSRDLSRDKENVLFSLLQDNMKPLYEASALGWTPRIKRGEMRMRQSRFMVLYAEEKGDHAAEEKTHPHKTVVDGDLMACNDQGLPGSDKEGRSQKRAACSPLRSTFPGKRTRITDWISGNKRREKEVAGYVMFQFDTDSFGPKDLERTGYAEVSCAYLYEIQVRSSFRGQGIGSWMLQCMSFLATHVGVAQARLTCFQKNVGAKRLYERNGYVSSFFSAVFVNLQESSESY